MRKAQTTSNKAFKIASWILAAIMLVLTAFLIWEIVKLGMLPENMLMIGCVIILIIAALVMVLQLGFTRGTASKIILTTVTVMMILVYGTGTYYISKASGLLGNVTDFGNETTTTVQVIALKDSGIKSEKDLEGKTVGSLKSISLASTQALIQDLSGKGVTFQDKQYDNIQGMVNGLYDKEVPAIILNDAYRGNINDLEDEKFRNFGTDTQVVYTYTYKTENKSTTNSVDDITKNPFTVLISGVDSRDGFAESSRSDVNMLATINPVTRTVLLTSIPRDYYVTTACDEGAGCQNGAKDKLTHTGLHGTETTKKTIESLLGIDINYTAKVNFTSVVNLVDALGGIDVDVKPGLAVDHFYTNDYFGTDYGVTEGINHLNGQAALCYARERYAYQDGDRQRVKNQQEVLMAIVKKATSPSVIGNYPALMDALSGAFQTDLSQDEIQSLIQFQLKEMPDWQFLTYSLDGQGSTEFCAELGNNASVMIPDNETVVTAKKRIEAVIEGKSAEEVEAINADPSEVPANDEPSPQPEQDVMVEENVTVQDPGTGQDTTYDQTVQEPVYTDPGYVDPGYTDPSYVDPGYTDPGYVDGGYVDPGVGY
ncbi:LCP family glycopolymer transferase [Faecalibaculum rodentium]|uniref:LCP family glycopolymer transferase n=1 Tax=Faecalibaculum rodentium TaxID=1702221 RepID=UPI002729E6DB|nr:LCP family protein [Faecalibaculum rodentium]